MSEKGVDFEKYLSESKWIALKDFDFDNENERDDFFVENGLAEEGDYIEMRLLDRGVLGSIHDDRFKGIILIDAQDPDKAKAAGFSFDKTKGNFINSEKVKLTPNDFQMLTRSLGGDFGLWCIFAPRQAGNYETLVSPDDNILKSRGKVL